LTVIAHVFLAPYTLPVPFWMYLYGCAATLILSFALLAYLATADPATQDSQHASRIEPGAPARWWRWIVVLLRTGAMASLALTIVAGIAGPADPGQNVGMTLFWVCFLLTFVYLTAIVGDIYAWINPWNTLANLLEAMGVDVDRRRLPYPAAVAYWPAVAWYIALIWIELFALPRPATLAVSLISYTAVTLAGIVAFGRDTWLRHGEVFAVLFRVVGTLGPVGYQASHGSHPPRVVLRPPLSEALNTRADHLSLVIFVLFLLSSTTYDTIHETYLWVSFYWQRLLPLVQPLVGTDAISAQVALTTGYWWYQWLGLVVSPAFYLLFYVAALWLAVVVARVPLSVRELATCFAFSLVPIGIAYHATHYVPSMLMQLRYLLPQLADPLAQGWRLLPVDPPAPTLPLPMAIVWHVQVFVLLAGHVAAVYVAHFEALRVFPTRWHGVASQLPMLALMIGYTCLGLWALSLPLGLPQIVTGGG
jgi:hypothetical protein